MRTEYQDIVNFLIVYIKEAHPVDEWHMKENESAGVLYEQPKTMERRMEMAHTFVEETEVGASLLVDDITNPANACYAAWPERIYIIGADGRIAYKGGLGPGDFKPGEAEAFIRAEYLN